jgi:5-methylcytosine-specific restriction endonuclease McrA
MDYKFVSDGKRNVFKFYFKAIETSPSEAELKDTPPSSRLIPSEVKKEVWKRDKGTCVLCGAQENLHFDHDIPWSRGGASITADNVRILCARHNIEKRDKIE